MIKNFKAFKGVKSCNMCTGWILETVITISTVNTTLVTKNNLSLEFSLFADLFILTLYLILGNSDVPFNFETRG